MSVLAVGFNHRTADLALLERLAVPAEEVPAALASLLSLEHVLEAAVLSTCNRVEVYAVVTRFHPGLHELRGWFADRAGVAPQALDDVHYAHYDEHAAAHLFSVAGGLDSMIVGEQQIAVQVKQAMEVARHEGAARRVLQRMFRQAVRVGRRLRRETDVASGASSMVDVGLDLAAERLGGELVDGTVLIVGAGKLGGLTATHLHEAGTGRVLVWNRSLDKAERLAARIDAEVVPATELTVALAAADMVVCTTGAPKPILDEQVVIRAMDGRERPLVLLDLAMPRNVAPGCGALDAVTLLDITHVRAVSDEGPTGAVLEAARGIVDDESRDFLAWTRAIEVEPTIKSLRSRAEHVRAAELERLAGRLGDLDEREMAAVEALTRGIVNTLLHEPSVRLKELADHGGGEHYANALRELFDLDE